MTENLQQGQRKNDEVRGSGEGRKKLALIEIKSDRKGMNATAFAVEKEKEEIDP